jgi:DNA-binding NarL/FixJ family response regulator
MSKSPQIPVGFITMDQTISRVEPLIKAGLTDAEIADKAGLSEQNVERLRRYIKHRRLS